MAKYDVKVQAERQGRKPAGRVGRIVLAILFTVLRRMPVKGWLWVGIVLAVLIYGTPYLLITYSCYGRCGHSMESDCAYLGVQGWRYGGTVDGRCPRVRLFPLDL